QIVGFGVVDKRLDVIASAIQMKANVRDVANFDLSYAPPYSQAMDTLTHSANTIRNKIDGLLETISCFDLKEKIERGDDFLILDIRNEEEFKKKRIEDERVIHIPQDELRERFKDLPKKEIVIVCQIGSRSYESYRFLKSKGFDCKILEGGLAFWFW
ncbi:MAG: pyridine nucleotide-disulfide oxidoreductase, partial [Archaeoglobales archaeon]